MTNERMWEAVNQIAEILTVEFKDLSTADHVLILQLSMTAIIDGICQAEYEDIQKEESLIASKRVGHDERQDP
jgi:hypothetical protein